MIKRIAALLLVAALSVSTVDAACHANCNHNGLCATNDVCLCYTGWEGASCNLRKCPYGKSFGNVDGGATGAHSYQECSGRGACDQQAGTCNCEEGYSGHACQRQTCPADCNNKGTCSSLRTSNSYTGWDKYSIRNCKCDAGYLGVGCTQRQCPVGDDPLSTGQVDEVQKISFLCDTTDCGGSFALKFINYDKGHHYTRKIDYTTFTVLEITEALQSLPHNPIDSVDVSLTEHGNGRTNGVDIFVTFSSSGNSGTQNLFEVLTADYSAHGHQPIVKMTGTNPTTTVTRQTTGSEENLVCAGRGDCNYETGECVCHSGFSGTACQTQTALT